jgi:hypothetical protein
MVQHNPISRRNLFRRSLGLQPREEARAQDVPSSDPAPEDVFPTPAAAQDVTPEKIQKRINAEPAYRLVLPRLLAFCSEPRSVQEIHEEMMYFPGMRTAPHSPKTLLTWMIEAGAIARYMEEGSEAVLWLTTEAGIEAIAGNDPAERLRRLLEEDPAYADIYRMILEFCSEEGRSISEIDYLLIAHPALKNPQIYPSCLVDRLEFAGALEWTGKWRATASRRQ